jgi:outer membrane protein assembly factor BamB
MSTIAAARTRADLRLLDPLADGSYLMKRVVALALLLLAAPACAGDWPQILGPTRNGVAQDEKLAWPQAGPKMLWRAEAGQGYAGPAVADGKVLLFERVGDEERLRAFDLTSGKRLWSAEFAATYRGGIDADKGPRCVPTIAEGRVYAFGADSDLHCVKLDGTKLWSRSLADDFKIPDSFFGAGSSPIVAGGKVWLNLGGKDAGLVALDPESGKTLYRGTDEQASYSSPTLAKIDGRESLIFITRYNCLGVDPKTGDSQFSFPFGKRGPTVNAATPLVFGSQVFVSASYGVGAKVVELAKSAPAVVWENDSSMSSQYTTCVYHQGYLYGVAGREDVGDASLRCISAKTGEVQWDQEGFGIAHIILAGDQLLIVRQTGEVLLAPASPKKFEPSGKAQLVRGTIRALPALSDGKLLIRTVATGGKGELVCVGL